MWVPPRVWGGLSTSSLSPRILALCPLTQLLPAERQTFGLYLRSHVPRAVSCLSHLCPALQLVFKSLGCPLGCLPPSQVPFWCHVRHFARKSHLGKDLKDKKINKFPLALG
ncbi:unnamed protein product [Rangifer tarandus platyrhynchus]|uniref:Uncharacterized protein n=1 Tax=Rangifer tarandus platyrhynchus TaxID=3082113 RepID=A0AC59ZA97_RANTA